MKFIYIKYPDGIEDRVKFDSPVAAGSWIHEKLAEFNGFAIQMFGFKIMDTPEQGKSESDYDLIEA